MSGFILVALFIGLLFLGVPIAFVMCFVSLIGVFSIPSIPPLTIFMKMVNGLNSFVLLSVPLFILAANLMNSGKISKKLIDFCNALLGGVSGGLAHANVLVSMIFAGLSGSSTADTSGIGKILIPSMIDTGYDKETAVGVTAASSTIGIIIPPSIPMVIYAGITNAPVSHLFMAGVVPGILIGLGQMSVIWAFSKKKNFPKYDSFNLKKVLKLLWESLPALFTIVIIIGGIMLGIFTPTEAAAVASIYAFFVSMFFYKTLKFSDLPAILIDTAKGSSVTLFALCGASALGELISYYQVTQKVGEFFSTNISSPVVFMMIVIALFLFLGTFMDLAPAMILFVPVILPSALAMGFSSVQLGLVIVMTLAIGLVTPPYGLCLLIAGQIADLSVVKSLKGTVPYILVVLVVALLAAFVEPITMWLPTLLYGG